MHQTSFSLLKNLVLTGVGISVILAAGCGQHAGSQPESGPHKETAVPEHSTQEVVITAQSPKDEADKIQSLIRELANIEEPDIGFHPNIRTEIFPPVPSSDSLFSQMHAKDGWKRSDALKALAELGPKALPYLLESLDDNTPTKLVVEHSVYGMGLMWYAERPAIRWVAAEDEKIGFLPQPWGEFNPENPREKKVLDRAREEFALMSEKQRDDGGDSIHKHQVTVGDICFVIIGQITGRSYHAVGCQPTACTFINSPVHDKQLAEDVRAIWQTPNAAKTLYDSLLMDFQTGKEWWGHGYGAIMRLGFYFPKRSESLLLKLLAEIDVSRKTRTSPFSDKDIAIIKAMSASKSEKVKEKLFEIMKRTSDIRCFRASLDAVGTSHDPLVLRRSGEFLKSFSDNEETWSNDGRWLLIAVGERFSDRAAGIYKEFLTHASVQGQAALCNVMRFTAGEISSDVLSPLLKDEREVPGHEIPIRLCDLAAETISENEKSMEFDREASKVHRDRQIQKIWRHCTRIGNGRGSAKSPE